MNEKNLLLAQGLVSKSYIQQATQSLHQRENLITDLLSQRKLPGTGWEDDTIQLFLTQIALMDSNNFISNVGVGEREGRVHSALVRQRNYSLSHGIGRSGELCAEQPKAAGSSLLLKLTHYLVLDALKLSGFQGVKSCIILPLATGMGLSLTLMALKQKKPKAEYVVWPRIDQKTCLKCIITAGLKPLVVSNVQEGDEIRTNLKELESIIAEKGTDSILCVLSTTSCFAPRAPDRIIEIAKLCKERNIGHIINNAYGVQASRYCSLISEACRQGRVDAFVQSTDKNFLVPVGGSIVASCDSKFIDDISKLYPEGRASISPILDLFITLLSLGASGYKKLLQERKELMTYFQESLTKFASAHNERVLDTPNNPISMAITLNSYASHSPTMLGSMLFSRFVSGTRVGIPASKKTVCDIEFEGYGTHINGYPCPYLNAACSIGITKQDIDTFVDRLERTWASFAKGVTKQEAESSVDDVSNDVLNIKINA